MRKIIIFSLDWRNKQPLEPIAVTRSLTEASKATGCSMSMIWDHANGKTISCSHSKLYAFRYLDDVEFLA